jgi:hypothetical protein
MPFRYEAAVYISNVSRYKEILGRINYSERVYCGSEFCEYKFIHDKKAYEEIAALNSLSLVLPAIITNRYFKEIEKIILRIASIQKDLELVVNDFGSLQWYSEKIRKFPVIVGRALCHFNFLADVRGRINHKILDLEKCKYVAREFNASRFEISSLPGSCRYILPKGINISLYYPYTLVTMSRNCIFRPVDNDAFNTICHRECGNFHLNLTHPVTPDHFVMIDNGYMLDCEISGIKDVVTPFINRYVCQML